MNKLPLNVIDIFSGCGGAALGFSLSGFLVRAGIDLNSEASEAFKINFPDAVVINSDVSSVSGRNLMKELQIKGGETILIGCPPCQGFSTARRKSQMKSDPRNTLIYEFVRLIDEIKPAAFVMENVPGLVNGAGRQIFYDVLCRLHKIGYGNNDFGIINTADYGIPQRRRRMVLIGLKTRSPKVNVPEPTHIGPSKTGLPLLKSWITVRNAIAELPRIKAGEKNLKDPLHVSASLSDKNIRRLYETPQDGGSRDSWSKELVLDCHKDSDGFKDVYGRMKWDYPSPTITGGCVMISKGRFGHPEQNRAISLREAARLQTFPDDFVFKGNFSEIATQIGNAVPPLLAKKLADHLIGLLNGNYHESEQPLVTSKISGLGNKFFNL